MFVMFARMLTSWHNRCPDKISPLFQIRYTPVNFWRDIRHALSWRLNGIVTEPHGRARTTRPARSLIQEPLGASLEIKKILFSPEAPAVAPELAILVNNPMTGDDDGDSVQAICVADRALRAGRSNLPRQVFVGPRLAVRYAEQFVPHPLLKWGAWIHQRDGELLQLTGKILLELFLEQIQVLITAGNDGAREKLLQREKLGFEHSPIREFQKAHSAIVCRGYKTAERAFQP